MDLSAERLRTALGTRPFEVYAQIESTNDRALAWLREGKPSGAVFIADEQTKGRGRLGRIWFSPPGTALMFSVALRPPMDFLSRVNMLAALSVLQTARTLGSAQVTLKWPNDVLLNGRKLCGVLSEAAWEGDQLLGVALGIGLNVRVDFTGTPLEATAVSLEPTLPPTDRAALLAEILGRIDYWTNNISSDALFSGWKACLGMLGKPISITSQGSSLEGTAEDVDLEGALLVRDRAGTLHRVIAGDIMQGN